MQVAINELKLNTSFIELNSILDYSESEYCKRENKCDLSQEHNTPFVRVKYKPKVSGGLKKSSEAIDGFLMALYNGFSEDQVAWGKLRNLSQWKVVMQIAEGYHNVVYKTESIAKDLAGPLLSYMRDIFVKKNTKVTLVMGHDSNINVVLNAMSFKRHYLRNSLASTPISGKVVFQKWFDESLAVVQNEGPVKDSLEIPQSAIKKKPKQEKAAKGLYLKERSVPPEVLGRLYAEYCDVINRMYDSYLNSVQLQRAPFILEIVSILMKRLYELRNELVHVIVNDYIYVDDALVTSKKTPFDIQIVVPYHFPLESREDSVEQLLQRMWADAEWRKLHPITSDINKDEDIIEDAVPVISEVQHLVQKDSSIILSEDFIQAVIIQKQERFRQFFIEDFRAKCNRRRLYFSENIKEAPLEIKVKAALLVQKVYRRYMEIKRKRVADIKRDILLGLIPDPFKKKMSFEEENNKMYERKRNIKEKCREIYLEELDREKMRLIVYKKEDQIDDITDHVRAWFLEWYYGYGFFPDYPYEAEGGTMLVVKGNYPTIAEKLKEDEDYANTMKGKTKEQLKAEMKQAKADALLKEAAAKEAKQREAEQLFRMRLNPLSDPGYQPKPSEVTGQLGEALQKYRAAWSIYDKFSPEEYPKTIYGFMQSILTEELMCQLHEECRRYVDELMRLDLKLLIKAQLEMFKSVGWQYPKMRPRKKPKSTPLPKSLKLNDAVLDSMKTIFDLGIISKPTAKIKDIIGDFKYAAYEMNIKDPDAT
ncbi:glucose-1-phosphatase/inositol phosphatase [Danaus plexippus plexippus]|uniref:Glucose-1-phosphatase/inositol phosphatase n=1 Tax=Danaus plexippus plexippus TaxID=278856 RepID=A0A212EYF7_DANPL|nr:glucose-1-phosphatase/inositol phosphatase [Danaus plexippus plexippus]